MIPSSPPARVSLTWIDDLVAQGRSSFTTDEARTVHQGSEPALQGVLRRLRARAEIATPVRGFHLILPPEYRRLGCLPPLWFADDLARFFAQAYYVAFIRTSDSAHGRH